MAKQALDKVKGIPLPPTGMNDNSPLQAHPDFYQTRGVHSLSERCLQRMSGKELANKFDAPILNLHGDLKGFIWVETATTLYLQNTINDPL